MPLIALLIFLAFPLLEIALLIKAGQAIGLWPTLLIVVGSAVLGAAVLRQTGFTVLRSMSQSVAEGRAPIEPVVEGFLLTLAGMLLLLPGLICDAIGLLLLVSFVRRALTRWLLDGKIVWGGYWRRDRRADAAGDHRNASDSNVIEGEFKRLDEQPPPAKRKD